MLFCVMCSVLFVLSCTLLYCPVLHCNTLPPDINQFAVNIIIIIIIIILPSGKYMGIQNLRFFKRKDVVTSVCCFGCNEV